MFPHKFYRESINRTFNRVFQFVGGGFLYSSDCTCLQVKPCKKLIYSF